MKKLVFIMLCLCLVLAGCETFKGFGQDMQNAGDWIERKAEEAK